MCISFVKKGRVGFSLPGTCRVDLLEHGGPIVADDFNLGGMVQHNLACVEGSILVGIEVHIIGTVLEHIVPLVEVEEAIMQNNSGIDTIVADKCCSFLRPVEDLFNGQGQHQGLVHETVYSHHILVPILGEEFGHLVMDFERSLAVQGPVCAVNPVNTTLATTMIPTVLATRKSMNIELHAKSIFAAIFDSTQKVTPGNFGDIWIIVVSLDGPVGVLNTNMVQSGLLDLLKVGFR